MPPEEVAERAGLPAEAGQDLAVTAIHLPLYRLCYVADVLDVSLDWLLGREPAARSEQAQQQTQQPQRQQARTAPRA
ncbi:hypothetical protein JDN40_12200 [Rhodomicrobium vannielii ATCC 17100]|jgi:hypothetical protein|uniref:hypothetical protein n=1 Tax=Rhodomicrobium vannielii TaxID=1069 RepID=UPI00191B5C7E|nr:hypothetical protein [Rhodomicrobium vannielii]MBJ7534869.1 hypothetical protein [Rhodomicrobium vannielii ATCC 17100]